MYNTFSAASPCEKIVSFFRNSATVPASPAESRKSWGSKAGFCVDFRWDLTSRERLIFGISQPQVRIKAIIIIGLDPTRTIGGPNSVWRVRDAVDFCQQSSHFAKDRAPLPRVFRRLELREGLFLRSHSSANSFSAYRIKTILASQTAHFFESSPLKWLSTSSRLSGLLTDYPRRMVYRDRTPKLNSDSRPRPMTKVTRTIYSVEDSRRVLPHEGLAAVSKYQPKIEGRCFARGP
jgi:hypothetical protein